MFIKRLKRAWNALKDPSLTKRDFKKLFDIVTSSDSLENKKKNLNKALIYNKNNKVLAVYLDVLFNAFEKSLNTSIKSGCLNSTLLSETSLEQTCCRVLELSFIIGSLSEIFPKKDKAMMLFMLLPVFISTGMFSMGSLVSLLWDIQEFNDLDREDLLIGLSAVSECFLKLGPIVDDVCESAIH